MKQFNQAGQTVAFQVNIPSEDIDDLKIELWRILSHARNALNRRDYDATAVYLNAAIKMVDTK